MPPPPAQVRGGGELKITSERAAPGPHFEEEECGLLIYCPPGHPAEWELPARNVLSARAKGCKLSIEAVTFKPHKKRAASAESEHEALISQEVPADRGIRGGGDWHVPAERTTRQVEMDSPDLASEWAQAITDWAYPERRVLHCIVNPFSGKGKGETTWRQVEQILSLTPHRVVKHATRGPGDAVQYCRELQDLPAGSVVAAIGGDGTMSEALNGLMQRADAEKGRFTVSFVPAGSSNALAHMSGCADPITAAWALAKARTRSLDLYSFTQCGDIKYGFLSVTQALIADIDIDSEVCRCCGPARFTAYALMKVFCCYPSVCCCCGVHPKKSYHCRVRWLPAGSREAAGSPAPGRPGGSRFDSEAGGWESWEGDLQFFQLLTAPAIDPTMRLAANTRLDDGEMEVQWRKPLGTCSIAGEFDRMEASEHLDDKDAWNVHRVAALHVDRLEPTSKVAIDGELTELGAEWQAEIMPRYVNVVVGSGPLAAFR
eukprot:TRINITY_DN6071_c0_g1_i1.p1 TRINITY_DN6071_c0_g1~~TRINITY_DN6071_c0_g1_i1.p1  ORF type:complete len:515 (+),score=148.51 TRINITY_DN6071_c0_g1_i1:82-1545(+)